MNGNEKFFTIEETTEILGISEQEIIKMIMLKKLPVIKVGKAVKIREEDLDKFLDSLGKKVESTEAMKVKSEEVEEKNRENEKRAVERNLENKKSQLEKSYKDLLRKKQELEEDINYLQYEYDEFRNKINELIVEESKTFLKKLDKDSLKKSYGAKTSDFNDNLEIDKVTEKIDEESDEIAGSKAVNNTDNKYLLELEDDRRSEDSLKSGKENQVKL